MVRFFSYDAFFLPHMKANHQKHLITIFELNQSSIVDSRVKIIYQ